MTPILSTERLILRLATQDDVLAILDYYLSNREYLTPYEPLRSPNFYTTSFWERQIQQNREEFDGDRTLRLFVFKQDPHDALIGNINFTQFMRGVYYGCSLGYSLAEIEQGKGYMTEALQRAISYVFEDLTLHRISANYMPHNQQSGRLLKRLGFVVEGYARDYLLINGQWQDHILTSLTNPAWTAGD